jgi:hypothetical protein
MGAGTFAGYAAAGLVAVGDAVDATGIGPGRIEAATFVGYGTAGLVATDDAVDVTDFRPGKIEVGALAGYGTDAVDAAVDTADRGPPPATTAYSKAGAPGFPAAVASSVAALPLFACP